MVQVLENFSDKGDYMAFDVMQSLFGLTPTAVNQALKAEEEARARTQVNLLQGNPFAAGAYGALQSGERMLTGVRNLTGQVDPRLQAAQQLQGIVQGVQQRGVDLATPEGLIELANELNTVPDFTGFAVGMRQQAAQMQAGARKAQLGEAETISKIEKNRAEAMKAMREQPEPSVKTPAEFATVAGQLGFGVKPNLADYTPEQYGAVNAELERKGTRKAEAGAAKIEVAGQKNILDIDKEDAKAYNLAKTTAAKALPTLNRMQNLVNQGIIVGTLPDARLGFLRALDTLGVSTADAKKTVANTEQFNNQVRLLLQSIIKQFGYNPSNADVKFALESLPNNSNSPEGLKAIIDALIRANQTQLNESTRALDYYRKNNGSFAGFTPNYDALTPSGVKTPAEMTTAELQAEIARLKAQQK